jgi:hypothetical protein
MRYIVGRLCDWKGMRESTYSVMEMGGLGASDLGKALKTNA